MRPAAQTEFTARHILDGLGFGVVLLLILFGLTLIGIGGFYSFQVLRESFRSKPLAALEKKAAAAIQSADLGWLAIICGPLLGAALTIPTLPLWLTFEPFPKIFYEFPLFLLLMIGVGAVAGAITAGAFWASSALLGNVRKATKRLRGVRDPEFDAPF